MSIRRNIRLLALFNFFLDFAPYNPIAVIYFAEVTGSYAVGLSVLSIASIVSCIAEVPTGILSDALGRKNTILLGSLSSAAAITSYAIGGSFAALAVGAVFAGLGKSFFSGNNEALLFETLKQENRQGEYSRHLGRTSSMFQVGLGTSAVLGGVLAQISLQLAFWASVIPQVICIVLALFFVEPTRHEAGRSNVYAQLSEAFKRFKASRKLRRLSIASIFGFGLGETMHQFGPVFIGLLWPPWALGVARMLSHALAALGFLVSGKVIARFSALKTLLAGQFLNRFGSIITYAFPTVFSPIVLPITSFFWGMGFVAQSTLLQEQFSDAQRATMGSLNSFFGNLVYSAFAIGFGAFADRIGPAMSLLIGELLLLPVICIYWSVFRYQAQCGGRMETC